MQGLNVCMAGATGWVGRALVPAIIKSQDLRLSGAVSRKHAGMNVSEVFDLDGVQGRISSSVSEALNSKTDVLIDYTAPDCVRDNVITAIRRGVHVVVGSSGLTDSDYSEIHEEAMKHGVGVVAAGNFAISAALLLRFATIAARYMSNWEIMDYASAGKIDSPSGTANELAYRISKAGTPDIKVPMDKMHGPRESGGVTLNGNQVHSIRLPAYVIGADVLFGRNDERLTLRFEAGNDATTYVEGTLLAARRVVDMKGLTRGLDNLLDL